MENKGAIIIYQADLGSAEIEVKLEGQTVWLTQAQITELFQSSKANTSEHIKAIYQSGELQQSATVRKFRTVRKEGKRLISRNLDHYNLDLVIRLKMP